MDSQILSNPLSGFQFVCLGCTKKWKLCVVLTWLLALVKRVSRSVSSFRTLREGMVRLSSYFIAAAPQCQSRSAQTAPSG
mmetsp:Transcript_24660/g.64765  ORF Transcript_24660/g.64765 Transcript_24660/m.64765 type:complete len:80 (-) Transcript_24660:1069-1308(-)